MHAPHEYEVVNTGGEEGGVSLRRPTKIATFFIIAVMICFFFAGVAIAFNETVPSLRDGARASVLAPISLSMSMVTTNLWWTRGPVDKTAPATSSLTETAPAQAPHLLYSAHSPSPIFTFQPESTPSLTPFREQDPRFNPIPIEPFWDGEMDTFPAPIPFGYGGPARTEALGKFAYLTMFEINQSENCKCLALALVSSIAASRPAVHIDIVVAVVASEDLVPTPSILPNILGVKYYMAFLRAGAKFLLWRPLALSQHVSESHPTPDFTKFRAWKLVQYEKVLFLNAGSLVLHNLDHLFALSEFTGERILKGECNKQ
eukprot:c10255_g1_i1.p1 GENE.c10255_g1_i1~~c10255_g1_i1.p1  ORF type:complete len:316 (-),score=52.91 c10255_g1_i1:888-1835(-)